ncbi:hypothetical protein MLD38_001346 [Melastoma candidum]|uniref:Uncharacterized protein n=1 Tax=Melastoma candidum TaxID=119954 RepID=A0ACB9SCX7_9MYRT|nr:hypothetical protein MLD38_001346 [Melastoma candidum]
MWVPRAGTNAGGFGGTVVTVGYERMVVLLNHSPAAFPLPLSLSLYSVRSLEEMGCCVCPLETPARLLWTTSFFRHKLMIF